MRNSDRSNPIDTRKLRSGYTTGSCAAAASKAAALMALGLTPPDRVEIPLPGGKRAGFNITNIAMHNNAAWASVIKESGDDPDITNGAEIRAFAELTGTGGEVRVSGGKGVGTVTRPGLAVPPGQPAINPVPMSMIKTAVAEALAVYAGKKPSAPPPGLHIEISVPEGIRLAEHTLNARLGIVGGISILGTTGIVRPLSTEAWTATIACSLDVAEAMGFSEVVLSSGRTSERAMVNAYGINESACVMMGDHVEFSIKEAGKHGFERLLLAAQWAKMLKIAMQKPDTHVRAGALDVWAARGFLLSLGINLPDKPYNTAREILESLKEAEPMVRVCGAAAAYAARLSGKPATAHLISYEGEVLATSE